MAIFGLKKKKQEEEKETNIIAVKQRRDVVSSHRHEARVENLRNELVRLSNRLGLVEVDSIMTKTDKDKCIDSIVKRMTFIRYEIDIREGLLKWL